MADPLIPAVAGEEAVRPMTLGEMIDYNRQFALDVDAAIADGHVPDEMLEQARADREMALRVAKSLTMIPDYPAISQQAVGWIAEAREIAQAQQDVAKIDAAQVLEQRMDALDGKLENAMGGLAILGAPLEPDDCEVCDGARGGVKGNENIIDGKRVCDYCDAAMPR